MTWVVKSGSGLYLPHHGIPWTRSQRNAERFASIEEAQEASRKMNGGVRRIVRLKPSRLRTALIRAVTTFENVRFAASNTDRHGLDEVVCECEDTLFVCKRALEASR